MAHQRTVLILEDDALQAWDLARIAEDQGFEVLSCSANSGAALSLAEAQRPDVAIVNLALRDGNTGLDAARHLSALGVHVIVVSGTTQSDWDGAFLAKPVSQLELIAALERAGASMADEIVSEQSRKRRA